jgi:hypothetical protein
MRCTGSCNYSSCGFLFPFESTNDHHLTSMIRETKVSLDLTRSRRPGRPIRRISSSCNVLLVPQWNFSPLPWRLFPLHDWSFLKQSKQWSIHRCHVDFHILADVCHSPPLGRVIVSVLICMLRETLSSKSLQASANLPYRLNEMSPYAEGSVWYWTHQRSHYLTLTCVLILCIPMAWVIVSDWKWVCVLRYISIPFHIYKQNQ